jgi:hypothetical protein
MFDAGHVNPQTTERYKHLAGSHVASRIRSKSRTGSLVKAPPAPSSEAKE